jgi:hypothetical protein
VKAEIVLVLEPADQEAVEASEPFRELKAMERQGGPDHNPVRKRDSILPASLPQ